MFVVIAMKDNDESELVGIYETEERADYHINDHRRRNPNADTTTYITCEPTAAVGSREAEIAALW